MDLKHQKQVSSVLDFLTKFHVLEISKTLCPQLKKTKKCFTTNMNEFVGQQFLPQKKKF